MSAMYGFGMIGNAWIFHGRHFGWMALCAVIAVAAAGYWAANRRGNRP
jgi:hypothetical protein